MVEGPTDESSLKGLADAVKLLYDTEAREWTAGDVISLLDELSGVAFPLSLVHAGLRAPVPLPPAVRVVWAQSGLGKLLVTLLTAAEV